MCNVSGIQSFFVMMHADSKGLAGFPLDSMVFGRIRETSLVVYSKKGRVTNVLIGVQRSNENQQACTNVLHVHMIYALSHLYKGSCPPP